MKLKRAKAYRKLMHQYEIQFGFREPYQVLIDSHLLQDAHRFKIDLIPRLEGILQGKVKPMVTQCDMRHLYSTKDQSLIEKAKAYERRRCGHHELDQPLSSEECLRSVVDPKGNLTNKNRYIIASQDRTLRAHMRAIPGVPLVYISKSVVILEPMNTATENIRDREEKSKFRVGLKGHRNPDQPPKRKRDEEDHVHGDDVAEGQTTGDSRPQKKQKRKGPKEPNPLSVKKAKKEQAPSKGNATKPESSPQQKNPRPAMAEATENTAPDGEGAGHRKRKRKHKPKSDGDSAANVGGEAAAA